MSSAFLSFLSPKLYDPMILGWIGKAGVFEGKCMEGRAMEKESYIECYGHC